MESAVAELKQEGFRIKRMEVRRHTRTADDYEVRSIPTFIYLIDGHEVRRSKGAMSANSLREMWRRPLLYQLTNRSISL